MPSWVADDDKWEKAKKAAADQGRAGDYAYVTGIFKQMGGKIRKQTMKAEIDTLRDLLKARDVSKLTKKTITNKLGHKTTVYVRAGEKPEGGQTEGKKPATHEVKVGDVYKIKRPNGRQSKMFVDKIEGDQIHYTWQAFDKGDSGSSTITKNKVSKWVFERDLASGEAVKDTKDYEAGLRIQEQKDWMTDKLNQYKREAEAPKSGTTQYKPDKKAPFKQFEELARSHSQTDAFRAVGTIKGVPREVSQQFQNKYGEGGKLSMAQAWGNFYREVAGNKDSMDSIKMVGQEKRKDNEGNEMTSWKFELADGAKLQVSNAVYGGQRRWRVQSNQYESVLVAPDKQYDSPKAAVAGFLSGKSNTRSTDMGDVMNQAEADSQKKPKGEKRFTENEFADKTSLLPDIIAETVANERDKDDAFTKKFQTYVKKRMLDTYNANPEFRKKLNGARGRDVAYTFVRHWLDHVEKRGFTPGAPAGGSTMKAETDNLRSLLKASPLVKAEEVKAAEPSGGRMGEALRDCDKAFIKSLGSIATALGDSTKERLRNLVQYDLRWQTNAQEVMNRVDAAYMFETGKEIPDEMRKALVAATNAIVTQNAQDRNQKSQVSEEKITYQPTLAKAAVDPQWRGLLSVDRVSV